MGLSQRELADGIRVPYQRVNELVNARPATALRLAKYFGKTADLWMNLQLRWDLYHAQVAEARDLDRIERVQVGWEWGGISTGWAARPGRRHSRPPPWCEPVSGGRQVRRIMRGHRLGGLRRARRYQVVGR